jgi:rhodanese-related sulfurtransferase
MNSFISSFLKTKNNIANLSSEEFEKKLEEETDAVLIDVRTQQEFYDVRIPNSKLIDLMNPHFVQELEKLDKSKSYFLYCRSGNRSYFAAKEMMKLGFEKVFNLEPGIIGWKGAIER